MKYIVPIVADGMAAMRLGGPHTGAPVTAGSDGIYWFDTYGPAGVPAPLVEWYKRWPVNRCNSGEGALELSFSAGPDAYHMTSDYQCWGPAKYDGTLPAHVVQQMRLDVEELRAYGRAAPQAVPAREMVWAYRVSACHYGSTRMAIVPVPEKLVALTVEALTWMKRWEETHRHARVTSAAFTALTLYALRGVPTLEISATGEHTWWEVPRGVWDKIPYEEIKTDNPRFLAP